MTTYEVPKLKVEWLTEEWDSGDTWGSCLCLMADICDVLTVYGYSVPESVDYRPAMGLSRSALEDHAVEIAEALEEVWISPTDLTADLLTLDALADRVRANGDDH